MVFDAENLEHLRVETLFAVALGHLVNRADVERLDDGVQVIALGARRFAIFGA